MANNPASHNDAPSSSASSTKGKEDVFPRIIVLISHERSGSHFLTDMLKSAAAVESVDEVCNFNAVDPHTSNVSFLRFRYDYQIENRDSALKPDFGTQARLVDAYFAHLAGIVKRNRILIDIKYGHVHNFEIGWWPSERRPFLPSYLQSRKIKIIHLTRKNSLAAVASAYVGEHTGVWHVKTDADKPAASKVKVPVLKMVQEAVALEREKENFLGWLSGNACFHIEYEQFTGDEQARNATMKALCAFLGLEATTDFTSIYRKVTPPLKDSVENYEELLNAVRVSGDGRLQIEE